MTKADDATRKEGSGANGPTATMGPSPAALEPSDPLEGTMVGRYRIDARLGRGGMGDVYRAHDTLLDRAVALKVLRRDSSRVSSRARTRVIREARAAASLTHPNAVTVFDVGESDGDAFIAMELLEGEDLRSILRRGAGSREQRLRWLLEVARGLEAAHARGLVHRDVKPENMFVTSGGPLKILDFGIAKREGGDDLPAPGHDELGPSSLRTVEGQRIGTPRYMAPEQHAGHATDARTDEYAWGLIAVELLGGSPSTEAKSTGPVDEVRGPDQRRAELLRLVDERTPGLSSEMRLAILRALEPDKSARFPSMAPIVAALEQETGAAGDSKRETLREGASDVPGQDVTATTTQPLTTADDEQKTTTVETGPPPPPRSGWSFGRRAAVAVVALALASVTGRVLHGLYWPSARVASSSSSPSPSSGPPRPSSLRAEPLRTRETAGSDRYAFLSDGSFVVARDVINGVRLERTEAPDGGAPLVGERLLHRMGEGSEVRLWPATYKGSSAVAAYARSTIDGSAAISFHSASARMSRRFEGATSGAALIGGPDDVLVIVTRQTPSTIAAANGRTAPRGAEVHRGRGTIWTTWTISEEAAVAPALARDAEHVAAAYVTPSGIRLAFLDREAAPIGDIRAVSTSQSRPTIAFAKGVAIVGWLEAAGRSGRILIARVSADQTAVPAAKSLVAGPLVDHFPVMEAFDDRTALVAWIAVRDDGRNVVRATLVDSDGVAEPPIDVGDAPSLIDLLQTVRLDSGGVLLSWQESSTVLKSARVTRAR